MDGIFVEVAFCCLFDFSVAVGDGGVGAVDHWGYFDNILWEEGFSSGEDVGEKVEGGGDDALVFCNLMETVDELVFEGDAMACAHPRFDEGVEYFLDGGGEEVLVVTEGDKGFVEPLLTAFGGEAADLRLLGGGGGDKGWEVVGVEEDCGLLADVVWKEGADPRFKVDVLCDVEGFAFEVMVEAFAYLVDMPLSYPLGEDELRPVGIDEVAEADDVFFF